MLFEQGLEGMYYIICVNEANDWWQLRKTDDHQVVACGVGKDYVLKALKTQVDRYKNRTQLREKWNSLEYIKPLKKDVLEARRLQYEVVRESSDVEVGDIFTTSPQPLFTRRRRHMDSPTPTVKNEDQNDVVSKSTVGTIRRRKLVKK